GVDIAADTGTREDAPRAPRKGRALWAGPLVAVWTFFDGVLVGFPILVLSTMWPPPLVLAGGATLWITMNVVACRWIEREWDTWVGGRGLEQRLSQLRSRPRGERAVARISAGSPLAFGVGAVLLSACQVIALHRIATGAPTGASRRHAAAIAP